jgi:hypothetical protein
MNKLNTKLVIVAIGLLVASSFSFSYWTFVSNMIMKILESKFLSFTIWAVIIITTLIHYNKNHGKDKNLISDKEGLEKPIDYIQFIFTYGAIGSSIQVLAKETFANLNFKELAKCSNFSGFDNLSFVIVIIVLIFYSYGKVKPIIEETYIIDKSSVKRKSS